MSQYPEPVTVPYSVEESRRERLRLLVISCLWGIGIRFGIVAAELLGVYFFNSYALFLDALASFVDVLSTVLLVVCLRLAARPPDANHPFGHGRFEPLFGLQLGLVMACIGAGMMIQQSFALSSSTQDVVISPFAWIVPLLAVILLEICYKFVMRTARRQHSTALAADAFHYRIDAITSVCATLALAVGAFVPEWSHAIDHMGAILIAILMVGLGLRSAWENTSQLLDRVPDEEFFTRVRVAALRAVGVRGTEKIRIQQYGPDAHVDIDVEVDPTLSVEVAHGISQRVRVEIQKEWPAVQDVTVHIEPFYPNDH
jgi:cation diffusion facilitator family transporter